MFLALVAAVVLESPPPPSVEMTRTGTIGEPVSASPRTLADVAREMRDGRRTKGGGFSAVESTVPRQPIDPRWLVVEEERPQREVVVVPEPEPAGYVSNDVYGWGGGGWWGPPPRRRPPHVSHPGPKVHDRRREGGGGRPPVTAGASASSYTSRFLPPGRRSSRSQ